MRKKKLIILLVVLIIILFMVIINKYGIQHLIIILKRIIQI